MKQGKQNPGTQVIYDPEWFNPLSPVYCRSPLEEITVSIPDMGEFRVRHNHITNPGRFEGENIYIPYFWSAYLNGCADSDDGRVLRFKVTKEDRQLFPGMLNRRRAISLIETDQGFVCEV